MIVAHAQSGSDTIEEMARALAGLEQPMRATPEAAALVLLGAGFLGRRIEAGLDQVLARVAEFDAARGRLRQGYRQSLRDTAALALGLPVGLANRAAAA